MCIGDEDGNNGVYFEVTCRNEAYAEVRMGHNYAGVRHGNVGHPALFPNQDSIP